MVNLAFWNDRSSHVAKPSLWKLLSWRLISANAVIFSQLAISDPLHVHISWWKSSPLWYSLRDLEVQLLNNCFSEIFTMHFKMMECLSPSSISSYKTMRQRRGHWGPSRCHHQSGRFWQWAWGWCGGNSALSPGERMIWLMSTCSH